MISQLQFFDMVIDAPCCAGLQVPGAVVVETVEFSQLPLLRKTSFPGGAWTRLSTCPLACRLGEAHRRGDELMG